MFGSVNLLGQGLNGITCHNSDRRLSDDFSGINFLGDPVNRTPGNFYALFKSPLNCPKTLEAGKKAWVKIDDRVLESAKESGL